MLQIYKHDGALKATTKTQLFIVSSKKCIIREEGKYTSNSVTMQRTQSNALYRANVTFFNQDSRHQKILVQLASRCLSFIIVASCSKQRGDQNPALYNHVAAAAAAAPKHS